jgi:hypothetical protein
VKGASTDDQPQSQQDAGSTSGKGNGKKGDAGSPSIKLNLSL